jgi:hypothetical protein
MVCHRSKGLPRSLSFWPRSLALLGLVTACSSPDQSSGPAATDSKDHPVLDGSYVRADDQAEFVFDARSRAYSVSFREPTQYVERGTFEFVESRLTLRSDAGGVTELDLDVLETAPLTTKAAGVVPQEGLVIGQNQLLGPGVTNVLVSQCRGGVSITYTNASGQSCSLFLSNATITRRK